MSSERKRKRNPYVVVEKVLSFIGWSALGLLLAFMLFAVGLTLVREYGWWAPIVAAVGLVVFLVVVGFLAAGGVWLEHKWKEAKWNWSQERGGSR